MNLRLFSEFSLLLQSQLSEILILLRMATLTDDIVAVSMAAGGVRGHAVQIVEGDKEGVGFRLNMEGIKEVLLHPNVVNKSVVILSVAGAFRKGKSFLLDFMLRYLMHDNQSEWLSDLEESLSGFSWKSGSKPDTNGILLWSEPFLRTIPHTGEEVALLLMDTQGAFDTRSTVKQNATIFALSTMLSSMQVYNLMSQVQENDLQHLQLFTEYARLASDYMSEKPFQSLLFLVRDWYHMDDHAYGDSGGKEYLESVLNVHYGQQEELSITRKHIQFCFDDIRCYLMPHPGMKVAVGGKAFSGQLKHIESEFVSHLRQLIPTLLDPVELVVKKISGNVITGKKLMHYVEGYVKIFQAGELPEPKSMLEATAEANHLSAKDDSLDAYKRTMDEICGPSTPFLNSEELDVSHSQAREDAFIVFRSIKKMGGNIMSEKFENILNEEIGKLFEEYCKTNDNKNIFMAARTPAVLISIIVVCYLSSGVVGLISGFLANLILILLGVALLLLTVWAVSRYTGQYRDLASMIDSLATFIFEQAIYPYYKSVLSRGSKTFMKQLVKQKLK